jgi:hypothetical protein
MESILNDHISYGIKPHDLMRYFLKDISIFEYRNFICIQSSKEFLGNDHRTHTFKNFPYEFYQEGIKYHCS